MRFYSFDVHNEPVALVRVAPPFFDVAFLQLRLNEKAMFFKNVH